MQRYIQLCFLFLIIFSLYSCLRSKTEYHVNGVVKSEVGYKGKKEHGIAIYYRTDGTRELEVNMKNGKKEGKMTRWFNDGHKVEYEANYKNDLLDGAEILYDRKGFKTMETHYKEGKKHGYYASWHNRDALKEEGHFWNDWYDGEWHYYDFRGFPVGEAFFEKGSGEQIAYDTYGHLMQITSYKENKKNGKEILFSPQGDTLSITVFENDRIIEKREF